MAERNGVRMAVTHVFPTVLADMTAKERAALDRLACDMLRLEEEEPETDVFGRSSAPPILNMVIQMQQTKLDREYQEFMAWVHGKILSCGIMGTRDHKRTSARVEQKLLGPGPAPCGLISA